MTNARDHMLFVKRALMFYSLDMSSASVAGLLEKLMLSFQSQSLSLTY